MPLLDFQGFPTPPVGKTLSRATLTVTFSQVYRDGDVTYPTVWKYDWDSTNNLWKPAGTADGTAATIPGGASGSAAAPAARFEEVQYYSNNDSQKFSFDQVITGVEGVWDYATVPANVRYVSALPGVPINTAWANVKVDYGGAGMA
jgi:hypothetical protein